MEINLSEKLKNLRRERNISQEKLADYLNISFQAVSKWENGNTYPDITLLPSIARFFGITVDELLQVEILDEKQLYREYEERAAELFRNGNVADTIPLWQEAHHKMPNSTEVKEMLMSAYFDTDKKRYQNEVIELGTEIYNSNVSSYHKGQAIEQIARVYAENGNDKMADLWASKAYQLNHAQEMIYMQILRDGEELNEYFRFANHWYFHELFYMAARLSACANPPGGERWVQEVDKTVAQIYELVYPDDDMSFESLRNLCSQHRSIAEQEIRLGNDESIVKKHLTRALECALKSAAVREHLLTHPLVYGWQVQAAPTDAGQVIRMLRRQLDDKCFDAYRSEAWFVSLMQRLDCACGK